MPWSIIDKVVTNKGQAMDMFALDEDVAQWEVSLLPLRGVARLPVLVPLAWHVRQRDSERADALAAEALALLPQTNLDTLAQATVAGRMQLVQAEVLWLRGALDAAEARAKEAFAQLCALGDHAGCADAHWLQAWIDVDRGDHAQRDSELALALAAARLAGTRSASTSLKRAARAGPSCATRTAPPAGRRASRRSRRRRWR